MAAGRDLVIRGMEVLTERDDYMLELVMVMLVLNLFQGYSTYAWVLLGIIVYSQVAPPYARILPLR